MTHQAVKLPATHSTPPSAKDSSSCQRRWTPVTLIQISPLNLYVNVITESITKNITLLYYDNRVQAISLRNKEGVGHVMVNLHFPIEQQKFCTVRNLPL